MKVAYDLGWVLEGFDRPTWKETPKAMRLRDEPEALAKASADQLAHALTICVRRDRFVEGGLNAVYESGLQTSVLPRAEVLLQEGT